MIHNIKTQKPQLKFVGSQIPLKRKWAVPGVPMMVSVLFYVFTAYLVVPVVDIPLLGLSFSAPIFFFVTIFCIIRPPSPWNQVSRKWILIPILIWLGIFLSTSFNGLLSGGINIDSEGIFTVIRYAYWLIVFVITAYFLSRGRILPYVINVLGWGVLILALLRWGEVIIYGNIGAWSETHLMSQNSYGFQFSTFSPFLLAMVFQQRGWKRLLAGFGIVLLWGAAAVNGSRGSWISISTGLIIALVFLATNHLRLFVKFSLILLIVTGISASVLIGMPDIVNPVEERYATFSTLDTDKSYAIRQLMNQKALKLFIESPLIGVGAERFKKSSILLEIPDSLSYASQDHFDVKSAHNSYLAFLAEYGMVGSFPLLILLTILCFQGLSFTNVLVHNGHLWALSYFMAFIQMSIHMWVISSFTNTANWFIYGALGAVIITGWKITNLKRK